DHRGRTAGAATRAGDPRCDAPSESSCPGGSRGRGLRRSQEVLEMRAEAADRASTENLDEQRKDQRDRKLHEIEMAVREQQAAERFRVERERIPVEQAAKALGHD